MVSAQCDYAMGPRHRNWRDIYFATALDGISAISENNGKDQIQEPNADHHSPNDGVLSLGSPFEATTDPPSSSQSTDAENASMSSPSTQAISPSLQSPWTESQNIDASPPTTVQSDSSSSPSTLGSPNLYTQEVRCYKCGKRFTGSSRGTNLRRHLLTAKVHHETAQFFCREQDCGASFSRRDNLKAHLQLVHGQASSPRLKRRAAIKRLREPDDEATRKVVAFSMV